MKHVSIFDRIGSMALIVILISIPIVSIGLMIYTEVARSDIQNLYLIFDFDNNTDPFRAQTLDPVRAAEEIKQNCNESTLINYHTIEFECSNYTFMNELLKHNLSIERVRIGRIFNYLCIYFTIAVVLSIMLCGCLYYIQTRIY